LNAKYGVEPEYGRQPWRLSSQGIVKEHGLGLRNPQVNLARLGPRLFLKTSRQARDYRFLGGAPETFPHDGKSRIVRFGFMNWS
jgi:hypothetical protein